MAGDDEDDAAVIRRPKEMSPSMTCPERTQKIEEANKVETEEAESALYMHEIVFSNDERILDEENHGDTQEKLLYANSEERSSSSSRGRGRGRGGRGNRGRGRGRGRSNAQEQPIQQPLRRSNRQGSRPTYLDDYLLQVSTECERLLLLINDEPSCFKEAKGSLKWRLACKDENDSINKNKTWFLVERSGDIKVIGLKWIFKVKKNADNTINKHKARLVFKVLEQATRCWNTKLDQILKGMGLKKCAKESAIYRKEEGESLLIIATYVDNLLVIGNTLKVLDEFKAGMSSKFEMYDLGKLTYYLGIEVHQGEDGIEIKQEGYARRILQEAGLDTCNPTQVPMEFGLKISKAQEEEEIAPTSYRKNVGCLRYLFHTRPDLAFSVGVASRYMQSPRKSHGEAMKHILRYLKGTMSYGLKFKRGGSRTLTGFSDSSHNIDQDDGRSTRGHIFYFGDDSRIDIKGKGLVVFVDMNGESRTMNDVYFIPDLKSSIISLGQATESGCDIRMRGRYLTMNDYDGKLLVKTERSRNRLYKVHMVPRETTCMHQTEISESSRWHARLRHINFKTIKSMVQGELVQGVPRVGYGTAGETRGWNWNNKESERERDVSFGFTLGEFGNRIIQEMIQSIAETEQVSDKEQALVEIENRDDEESIETEIARVTVQAIWLQDLLGEVIEFLKECVENGQVDVEHVPGTEQKADILTKALARIKFVEMRSFIGVQDMFKTKSKLKREIVG